MIRSMGNDLMFNFRTGSPQKITFLWGIVKHHFDDKFLANKGIDF